MGRALLVVLALTSCKREFNPEFCLGHPDDVRCTVDASPPCASNADCANQICDVPNARCVDCTPDDVSLCTPEAPICAADNTCHACVTDDDCAGSVCLTDGTCPAEDTIIYAAVAGSTDPGCGTRANACTLVAAIAAVDTTKHIVKLLPDAADYTVTGSTGLNLNKNVTVAMRGARIRKTSSGPVVTIGAGNSVELLGGALTGGSGGDGNGIACTTGSLAVIGTDIGGNATSGLNDSGCGTVIQRAALHNNAFGITKSGGSLTLRDSRLQANGGAGISLFGNGTQFTIIGNVFWQNGAITSATGAISLQTDTSTTSRLEFNAFNGNSTNGTPGAAVQCNIAGFVARNNIMFANGNAEQVSGNCTHVYSISMPGTPLTGTGDLSVDPMFVNASTGDLHTMPGSPAENAGDPASDLTGPAAVDPDGDPRTTPPDIGVDQHL